MKLTDIIQEEAPTGPIEISDVAEFFPNTFDKAVKALYKQDRLTFGGKKLTQDTISRLEQLAKDHVDGQTFPMTLDVDGHHGGKDEDFMIDIDTAIDDANPVYVGYDKRTDKMLVGLDAWLDGEDEFNDAFEEEFEKTHGEDYDHDNQEHQAIYNAAWKDFLKQQFVGCIVEIDGEGNVDARGEAMEGGFYNNQEELLRGSNVVDLRLD
jgi:hypothetical protein